MTSEKRVPILLVTGFLGAGKTTFLNWLIHTHPQMKVSLILNEFGDVKLESQFIQQSSGGEVAELANGCMCCVAKSDIPRVISYILEKSPQTEYILIEASGLSDPDPIHEALQNPNLTELIRLDSILCIVDAVNFEKNSKEHAIVMSQVGDADIVLISKVEEAGEANVKRVEENLKQIGMGTKVFEFTKDLNPALFLDMNMAEDSKINLRSGEENTIAEHNHKHEELQETWFKTKQEIDIDKLFELMKEAPAEIIRAKGFINSHDKKYLLQYVGSKTEIEERDWKTGEIKESAILFLATKFDDTEWQKKLDALVS